jgi:hypothetical protein
LQGRTGGWSFYLVAKCLRCAPYASGQSLLVVVMSGWLSSGDVESSVLSPLHTCTHLKTKKKKKFAPVTRMVVVTRKVVTYGNQGEFVM